jgi:uncharacterized Zn-binding protein involved in type VI secretion
MFIKSKLYIWLWIIGCFFLDISWFSGPIYGDDLFADKIKILQKEMQHCGSDATCYKRISKQISTIINQEYLKCGTDEVCIQQVGEALMPEAMNSGSGTGPVKDNHKHDEPLKQNPHQQNMTKNMDPEKWSDQCVEIQRLSGELIKLTATVPPVPSNFTWDWGTKAYHPTPQSSLCDCSKVNEMSLRIFSLMEELHTVGPERQIPDCDMGAKLTFCKKATVLFNGKGLIDRKDSRIEYKMTGRAPAFQIIDFTVAVASNKIIGFGFALASESPFLTGASTHVEFRGDLTAFDSKDGDFKRVKATQSTIMTGPFVLFCAKSSTHDIPYIPTRYFASVHLPRVAFYSSEGHEKGFVFPRSFYWPPIDVTPQDLQRAFEKGRLTLREKAATGPLSGTVTIDFAPPDSKLQAQGQSNPGGIGLWGDRTTHGGFILATGKEVFSDGHPVAREGDPVLCPIHGFSKVSRDESSGVYIGGRPVAFAGGKTDCGAKILSGSTLKLVRTFKQ